ncbi:MAG: PfkB family carbohydrate kinase [Bacilli bacterium]|nr:PfkB family carbohydrate kinase [Bacilli bacterium]
MRIISFDDMYVDYYMKDGELIGLCGGKTSANILVNLSPYFKTAFFGQCGNDAKGDLAIASLALHDIDTSNIKRIEGETKAFFLDNNKYSKECPYCHREVGYSKKLLDIESIISHIEESDVIIVDNLKTSTLKILASVPNKAFLDLGYLGSLLYSSLDEIVEMLGNRFEIISMNKRVYDCLKHKFAIDSTDLYDLLNPKILIITKGEKGCDIIVNGEFIKKEIETPAKVVDPNGAGDAFFAEFIRTYLESECINEAMISKAYMRASIAASLVVSVVGARSTHNPLYHIENYEECICKKFSIREKY